MSWPQTDREHMWKHAQVSHTLTWATEEGRHPTLQGRQVQHVEHLEAQAVRAVEAIQSAPRSALVLVVRTPHMGPQV